MPYHLRALWSRAGVELRGDDYKKAIGKVSDIKWQEAEGMLTSGKMKLDESDEEMIGWAVALSNIDAIQRIRHQNYMKRDGGFLALFGQDHTPQKHVKYTFPLLVSLRIDCWCFQMVMPSPKPKKQNITKKTPK